MVSLVRTMRAWTYERWWRLLTPQQMGIVTQAIKDGSVTADQMQAAYLRVPEKLRQTFPFATFQGFLVSNRLLKIVPGDPLRFEPTPAAREMWIFMDRVNGGEAWPELAPLPPGTEKKRPA